MYQLFAGDARAVAKMTPINFLVNIGGFPSVPEGIQTWMGG
jgi:hypothetical protein